MAIRDVRAVLVTSLVLLATSPVPASSSVSLTRIGTGGPIRIGRTPAAGPDRIAQDCAVRTPSGFAWCDKLRLRQARRRACSAFSSRVGQ
jgi:hypothetical protein